MSLASLDEPLGISLMPTTTDKGARQLGVPKTTITGANSIFGPPRYYAAGKTRDIRFFARLAGYFPLASDRILHCKLKSLQTNITATISVKKAKLASS